jgi:hypothetical protein
VAGLSDDVLQDNEASIGFLFSVALCLLTGCQSNPPRRIRYEGYTVYTNHGHCDYSLNVFARINEDSDEILEFVMGWGISVTSTFSFALLSLENMAWLWPFRLTWTRAQLLTVGSSEISWVAE